MVEDYQKACYMASNIGISITPEEETLIKVVPIPQGPIEWTWLNNTVDVISGKKKYTILNLLFVCHLHFYNHTMIIISR